jgi:hypothetical protein
MRLRARIVVLVVIAAFLTLFGATSAHALLKVKCGPAVAIAAVDPIVGHNNSAAMVHQHQIFGNNSWAELGNSANYEDLLAGDTTCRESTDTAGYWTPTLVYTSGAKQGQVVPVQQFTAYYRGFTNRGDTGPGVAYPADLRLVSEPGKYNWTCGEKSGPRSKPVPVIPDCTGLSGKPGLTLTAHIDFPSCWNGVEPAHTNEEIGDTRDNANWRYVQGQTCPSTHPIKTIALRETIQFKYVGNGKDVKLSSDLMAEEMTGNAVQPGTTMHGDFWNAWQQADLERLTRVCINTYTGGNSTCTK